MKYNELKVSRQKKATRVGRGISAGKGMTAGRGTKGQGSRKSSIRAGFEGGQMPIYMRLPKLRGFKSHRTPAENVYTSHLEAVKGAVIDNKALFEAGLVSSPYSTVKVISNGEINTKKTVKLQGASVSAVAAIEKAGGSFERIERQARPAKTDQAD